MHFSSVAWFCSSDALGQIQYEHILEETFKVHFLIHSLNANTGTGWGGGGKITKSRQTSAQQQ